MLDDVQPTIKFTSPEGKTFEAFWQGNEETKEKDVGRFHAPGTTGETSQDQGTKSPDIPLEFFFKGDGYKERAQAFFKAIDETGVWEVNHPEDGIRRLQPVSVTIKKNPIATHLMRYISSSWFEPTEEKDPASVDQLSRGISADVENFNAVAAKELDTNISQDQETEISAFGSSTEDVVDASNEGLTPLFEENPEESTVSVPINKAESQEASLSTAKSTASDAQDEYNSIEKSITDSVDNSADTAMSPLVIGLQLQKLCQSPAKSTKNIKSRLNSYKDYSDIMIAKLSENWLGLEKKDENAVNVYQVGLSSSVTGAALSITDGELSTRSDALDSANLIRSIFDDMTNALDDAQSRFLNNPIDTQYFSQTETFARLDEIVSKCTQFLLNSAFNLSAEKRFFLAQSKSPVQVCIEEYGSLGENDENLDYFYDTNNLSGQDNILLPVGKEVVVYK